MAKHQALPKQAIYLHFQVIYYLLAGQQNRWHHRLRRTLVRLNIQQLKEIHLVDCQPLQPMQLLQVNFYRQSIPNALRFFLHFWDS